MRGKVESFRSSAEAAPEAERREAAERHAAAGECCVLDATFGRAELQRQAIRRLQRRACGFYLWKPRSRRLRNAADWPRPTMCRGEISDAKLDVLRPLNAIYVPPRVLATAERVTVRNDGAIGGAVRDCLRKLVRLRLLA